MAKFTVFFKDKAIDSVLFESGVMHIGRDESNDLTLNSLAVAPAHAAAIIKQNGCLIKQLNDDFPLIVNGEKLKESLLNNNDRITLGKYSLIFNTTESVTEIPKHESPEVSQLNQEIGQNLNLPEANLQVMDGQHIGRILPMKKAMTRLGRNGGGIAVIARRKEGYFISSLENNSSMTINNQPLGDKTVKLNNNDLIVIDNTTLQFFQNPNK
ncbi:FHA domain-containing protein [Methylotuvimicrobium alcaliphilum]|uniref:Forkhead-associated protein n=1 Tax=Methylotuvimicrobium alcaliphilum (strain DSM 19304 / NCIMB 14124 / VKM B-2133 / 20Z) TaxID=1091494 RepID=G4T332_META2|nr:FHA domain-containing protein [Methylotuvimicrobium alcaliphilum]CCE24774.1 Forkhead-associated protein [Methylotuvimicrobium alcaliphilum 20Z]